MQHTVYYICDRSHDLGMRMHILFGGLNFGGFNFHGTMSIREKSKNLYPKIFSYTIIRDADVRRFVLKHVEGTKF